MKITNQLPRRHPGRRAALIAACAAFAPVTCLTAASHSDAPLIKQDPQANLTDVYAFLGTRYDDPSVNVLNVVVSVRPFSDPGDGVIYERFADDALYSIHITDPNTGVPIQQFDFEFSSVTDVKNPDTILSYGRGTGVGPIMNIGDDNQNFTQTYRFTARKVAGKGRYSKLRDVFEADDLPVSPPNVGVRTTPAYNDPETGLAVSGAVDLAGLDTLTMQAISPVHSGIVTWAGPREDGFYADTPGIFDFLDPRIIDNNGNGADGLGQDGGGVDGFKGFNVLTYGVQIPLDQLDPVAFQNPFLGQRQGVGVYASVSRKSKTTRSSHRVPSSRGSWVQVNRMGNPLFNEVLVSLRDKDRYNMTLPENDEDYRTYAENPEVAFLINAVLFADPEGDGPLAISGRTDLAAVYLPDVLRVDTTTGPVLLPGQEGYSRLSFIGGDTGGWPNGRRPGDDVVDIALTAVASGPAYASITVVGDNVATNDQLYNRVFPYLGTPHAGPTVSQRTGP
ncbi:DUF4331 domain-containing protein [Luteolibacter marinus]|uniref:DUF4331 domain-containing protein n=1 Tax=Luteolibacter marinus TaxID=2776705 RepID=UPI0018684029|nr:DUF4331 domain-containing protein [Luteolibacter marinus]